MMMADPGDPNTWPVDMRGITTSSNSSEYDFSPLARMKRAFSSSTRKTIDDQGDMIDSASGRSGVWGKTIDLPISTDMLSRVTTRKSRP